jgi:hypothetical protein
LLHGDQAHRDWLTVELRKQESNLATRIDLLLTKARPNRFVFVDVDGCLINMAAYQFSHEKACREAPTADCVAALNRITDETGAAIVVSSCWRIGRTVAELRELFGAWGITGVVLDKTPHLMNVVRGVEINEWLRVYRERFPELTVTFAILDDDADMADLRPYLVRTKIKLGLTQRLATKAINFLLANAVDVIVE